MKNAPIKKKLKVYTLDDLTQTDIQLLVAAANAPKKSWFCFGNSWYKLHSLNLIDEDTKVTNDGIDAIRSWQ